MRGAGHLWRRICLIASGVEGTHYATAPHRRGARPDVVHAQESAAALVRQTKEDAVGAAPAPIRAPRRVAARALYPAAVVIAAGLLLASPALAAPTPVGTSTASTSSTSLTVARPAGVVAGDVLAATVTVRFGAAAS